MQVVSGSIGKEKIHYQAPPAERVLTELKQFLSCWKASQTETEGVIRAGIAHVYFVTIHPFEDGNGRIARALTDMALAQDDQLTQRYYSMSSQILDDKATYYQILEQTQHGHSNLTEWLKWYLECLSSALDKSEALIINILAKGEFWRRHSDLDFNLRQKKLINKLLDLGPGNFQGGLSTSKYSHLTKVSRATAYREIIDLVKKGILKENSAGGRSTSYDIK